MTKGVSETPEGELNASAGNYGLWSLSGTVSGPLAPGLGGRLTALSRQRDGYADNLNQDNSNDELDNQDFQALRGKLQWRPAETFSAVLSAEYWRRDDTNGNDIINLNSRAGAFSPIDVPTAPPDAVQGINRDNVATAITVTVIDQCGQRGGFTRTGGTHKENQAALPHDHIGQNGR